MTKKEMDFEAAITELQTLITTLEEGKAGLEKSLELYERGMELVRFCNEKLENAEQKLLVIRQGEKKAGETV